MSVLNIKSLVSGGVIVNYHCVSRCGHCLYNCGPHRDRAYLGTGPAEAIFGRIAQLGCRSVHIGGGEPLLNPDGLVAVLHAAVRAGMGIDYVETNSAWYVDRARAVEILADLRAAGLRTLLISMSPFHNASIPFARVRGVIEACRETGIEVFPWVNAFVRDLDRLGDRETHGQDTTHFHIDLEGRYIPGLCTGLAFAMEDLGGPLPAGRYPLLERLADAGIKGLFDLARKTYGFAPTRESFLNHCDLCTDIRHYLVQREGVVFPELAPRGFYGL